MTPAKTPGQIAYEGYYEYSGGKSLVSGATIPHWPDMPKAIREAWEAAAMAVFLHRSAVQNQTEREYDGGSDFRNNS